MTSKLVLFTMEYPYGTQETFLESEISFLSSKFDEIKIVPLFGHDERRAINCSNVEVCTPVMISGKGPSFEDLTLLKSPVLWKVFLKGVGAVLKYPRGILKLIKQLLIIAKLDSYIKKNVSLQAADLWYFYWGTNAVNILPFLDDFPKSVARYHRYDLYDRDVLGGEFQLFQKETLKKLTKAICISEHGLNYLKDHFPDDREKFLLARLGVFEFANFHASESEVLNIVSCSNFCHVKRVELVAEALSLIEDFPIEWTHIGDGQIEMKEKTLDFSQKFPKNVKASFLGRISNAEVAKYYQEHSVDLFLNVSISEGVPVSIMEALSSGIPVMATDVGGSGELVDQNNGVLLPLDLTARELAEKISEFYYTKLKNEQIRIEAKNTWRAKASAQVNYQKFAESLKNI